VDGNLSRRLGLVAAAIAAYVPAFLLLHNSTRAAGVLVALPVLVAGVLFGRNIGILAGVGGVAVNAVLRASVGEGWMAVMENGGFIGIVTLAIIGGTAGWLRDMSLRVQSEIRNRLSAEVELQSVRRAQAATDQEARLLRVDRLAAVGTLAAGVAHQINNPLSVMLSTLQYLKRTDMTATNRAEGEAAFADAMAAGDRIRGIVSNLHAFASAGSASSAQCDVASVLRRTAELVRHEVETSGRLVVEVGELPLVRGDEARLAQVFLNLLMNAAQALPIEKLRDNEVRVTASANPEVVTVAVRDNGVGIPKDALPWIFDPFFSTKPVGVGTGLGLSVAYGIVKSVGGEIVLESEPGRGSEFRVSLPVSPAPAAR
jgi:two-component system NtrC family sensor kinase